MEGEGDVSGFFLVYIADFDVMSVVYKQFTQIKFNIHSIQYNTIRQ